MYRLAALFSFCLLLTAPGWSQQQDLCAGYQDSPDAPHHGPRKFNVIHLGFAGAGASLLLVDPEGRRFGFDGHSRAALREIPRAFYEDDNTAQADTGLPLARQPREITVHYAQCGTYRILITGRRNSERWLKVSTDTCGKRWQKQITLPASPKAGISWLTLIYDSHATAEPRLLDSSQR